MLLPWGQSNSRNDSLVAWGPTSRPVTRFFFWKSSIHSSLKGRRVGLLPLVTRAVRGFRTVRRNGLGHRLGPGSSDLLRACLPFTLIGCSHFTRFSVLTFCTWFDCTLGLFASIFIPTFQLTVPGRFYSIRVTRQAGICRAQEVAARSFPPLNAAAQIVF